MITIEMPAWVFWAFFGLFAINTVLEGVAAHYRRRLLKLRDNGGGDEGR